MITSFDFEIGILHPFGWLFRFGGGGIVGFVHLFVPNPLIFSWMRISVDTTSRLPPPPKAPFCTKDMRCLNFL